MVIAAVGYLLARDAGSSVEAEFLRSFKTGFLDAVSPTADDLARAADLVERYADCHSARPTPASSLWPSASTSPSW